MDNIISDFLFSMMPSGSGIRAINESINIYDNLDSDNSVKRFPSDMFGRLPAKLHFAVGIYCHQGEIGISANLRDYTLSSGDIFMCLRGTIISALSFSADCRTVIFCVSDSSSIEKYISSDTGKFMIAIGIHPLQRSLRESFRAPLASLCRMLRQWQIEPDFEMRSEAFYSSIQTMIALVASSLPSAKSKPDGKDSRAVQLYRRFLDEVSINYKQHRGLKFYADRCCVTSKYLGKVVKDISSRYPADIISDYIILDAKAMLLSGMYSVRRIADELHFPNPSFFCKYFRDAVGCSPLQFRRQKT